MQHKRERRNAGSLCPLPLASIFAARACDLKVNLSAGYFNRSLETLGMTSYKVPNSNGITGRQGFHRKDLNMI